MRTRLILLIVALTVGSRATAQVAGTQYFMNSVQQYSTNNPAFIPKYKFSLGLPGSMIDVGIYNSGFNYNDLTKTENGKRVVTLPRFVSGLPDKSYITSTVQLDLFRFGLRIGNGSYLSLNSSVRGYGRGMIPKDAVSLVVNGNASYIGKTASISPEAEMMLYWENSIGLAVTPVENLTVGARVKMLRGFLNANTATANATVSVADNYDITVAADLDARTSGLQALDDKLSLSNYSNNGFAFDLGATYKLLDKLTLAASLVDIGAIKWKYNTYQYTLDKTKATHTFTGFDMNKLVNGESQGNATMDSLETKFKPVEKQGSAYSTMLPAKAFLSANYDVFNNFSAGAVVYAERFMGRTSTGVTLGMNKHFGKVLSTNLSYTISNRSFNNLGAGLSLNLAPIQIYVVGDNLLRLPVSVAVNKNVNEFVNSTQVFNLRMGLNFVWGWKKDGKTIEDKSYNSKKKGVKTSSDADKHPAPKAVNVRKKKR
jgi:hypothetical protein